MARWPGKNRVEAGRKRLRIGLHRADRIGFDFGATGNRRALAINPYSHPSYRAAWDAGFARGLNWHEKAFNILRKGSVRVKKRRLARGKA